MRRHPARRTAGDPASRRLSGVGACGPRPRVRRDRGDDVRPLLFGLSAGQRHTDGAGSGDRLGPRPHAARHRFVPGPAVRLRVREQPHRPRVLRWDFPTTSRSSSVSWTSAAPRSKIPGVSRSGSNALSPCWVGTGCGPRPIAGSSGFRSTRRGRSSVPLWRAPGWHPDDPLPPAQSESRCLTAVGITICSLLHYGTASRCEWRTDTGRLDSSSLDDSSGSTCCLDLSARCNVFLALCLALILTASTSSTGIHSSFSADSMRSRSSSSRYSNCRSSASRINSMPSANHSVIQHRSPSP